MGPRKAKPDRRRRAGVDAGGGAGEQRPAVVDVAGDSRVEITVGAAELGAGDGSSSGSVEPVAPAGAGVPVDVDRPAILEEAAAVAAAASSSSSSAIPAPGSVDELAADDPANVGLVDVHAKAADVAPAFRMLGKQCAGAFAPNWEITPAEIEGVADAAALVAAYWMPDGAVDPRYVAILSLAGALYGVAAQRRAADGSWKPLRKPLERAPAPSSPTSPAPAGGAPGPVPLRIV